MVEKGQIGRTARVAGVPVLGELPTDTRAGMSLDDGRPPFESNPDSPLVEAIDGLVTRIVTDWPS